VYAPINQSRLSSDVNLQQTWFTGETTNKTYTLANGTTHNYTAAEMALSWKINGDGPFSIKYYFDFSQYNSANGDFDLPYHSGDDRASTPSPVPVYGPVNVRNSYTGTSYDTANGLPGQKVADLEAWRSSLNEWSNQSQTMISNYQDVAPDLYDEMDAGRLDPNEVRGAEGMVRYLSGDSNATEGDYRTALHYTLGTSNPNLTDTSTMKVHIDGYTEITWNTTSGSENREPIPTSPVNETVEGLLFADGVSSVSVNETYTTNATDGKTFTVIGENGTDTTLIDGNLTVKAIYDSSGNELENASYTEPKYGTYDAQSFVEYLNESEQVRAAILASDDSSSGVTIGDLFGNNPVIGLVVVGAIVALFLAGKFS